MWSFLGSKVRCIKYHVREPSVREKTKNCSFPNISASNTISSIYKAMKVKDAESNFLLKKYLFKKHYIYSKISIQKTLVEVSWISTSQELSITSTDFVKGIPNIFHWHEIEANDKRNTEVDECKSISQNCHFNNKLNSLRIKHVNKLNIAHLLTHWGINLNS